MPITGRPAGWCDLIARQWPVAGVVGENGAFVYTVEGDVLRRIVHPAAPETPAERLAELASFLSRRFGVIRIAKDQFARVYDLAIDFCEEPPDLGLRYAEEVAEGCREFGAHARVSSIHVNAWFGDYDKSDMTVRFLAERFRFTPEDDPTAAVYCGDSPNDEPLFARIPLSVGVANVTAFLSTMRRTPAYVTSLPRAAGFAEAADAILAARIGESGPPPRSGC